MKIVLSIIFLLTPILFKSLYLSIEENFNGNPYPEIYSTRLELEENKGEFGTNGKGRTREYASASGYAEFMERIQNHLFATFSRTMISELKEKHGFYYTPDEQYLKEKDFFEMPNEIVKDLIKYNGKNKEQFIKLYFQRLSKNGTEGIAAVPFYDTKNKTMINLPINLLMVSVGSNGMAAGNTVEEAVFQGICELMERWGAAEIFYNQITPPTVQDEFLKQFTEEYEIIKNIQINGKYKVIVKDFSANKKIPSVGIIIINKKDSRYRLNVGSDTCFQVALSRCLTEIYQGIENEKRFDSLLLNIPKENPDYFTKNDENAMHDRYAEFQNFIMNGSGCFPVSLFKDHADYPFDSTVFTIKENYKKEVQSMVVNLNNNGFNVYIRDNSYLGFPSVMIYIPEISTLGRKNVTTSIEDNKFNSIELDKIENLFFNIENCSEQQLIKIETVLSNFDYKSALTNLFNIELKKDSVYNQINNAFLLTQLRYRIGNYEKAMDALKLFRESRKKDEIYYEIVNEYLKLKNEKFNSQAIYIKILKKGFDKKVVEQVCEDLLDPKTVLKYVPLPKCPKCNTCGLQKDCITKSKINISHRLYNEMKNNVIDQSSLSWTSLVP